jgi:hypothetical protein
MRGALGVVEGGTVKERICGVLLLVMLALSAGLAVALSACGESAADEFVGTWRRSDYKTEWSPPLVITKTDDGYRGTLVYNADQQPHFDLDRVGDTLKGQTSSNRGPADLELTYQGQSGHLTWRGEVFPDTPVVETKFVRVSSSTSFETAPPP